MGKALEILPGFVTAAGATQTAVTMASGTSLTIRSAPFESGIYLLQAWVDAQAAGALRIRSARMHDNVQGLRIGTVLSEAKPLLPWGAPEVLLPQDVLSVDLSGSATAGDIETAVLLVFYENLPGIDAKLASYEEVAPRIRHIFTVENTLALGTAGGFSGEEAITAEFDLMKANTEYALLGYHVDTECAVVCWRSSDTGNLRVGGPGDELGRDYTADWFERLSRSYGLPCIPIFNSANKGSILLDGVQDENGADPKVTSILAELAS